MPIASPAGDLITLDDVIAEARTSGLAALASRYTTPALIIVAEAEAWATATESTGSRDKRPGEPNLLPPLVMTVAARKFTTNPNRLAVGRAGVCEVVLPFNSVSKVHAYLFPLTPWSWQLEEAGSTNGTRVDGLAAAKGRPVLLRDGCSIEFGRVAATFWLSHSFCDAVRRRARL